MYVIKWMGKRSSDVDMTSAGSSSPTASVMADRIISVARIAFRQSHERSQRKPVR
jgi:hypothetical protein